MAKKKRQKEKRKGPRHSPQTQDPRAEILAALQTGRGRKAHGLMKEMGRQGMALQPDLVVQVLRLRTTEMLSGGHRREALSFYKENLADNPIWQNEVPVEERAMLELGLGRVEIWEGYGRDAALDARLDNVLLTQLQNPHLLTSDSALSATHPLRLQAQAILDSWELIDLGKFTDALERLKSISRQSPVRAWRVFLQALIAFYQKDDAGLEAALHRLPAEAATAPLADTLRRLSGSMDGDSAVLRAARAGGLKAELEEIDRIIKQGRNDFAEKRIRALCIKLEEEGKAQFACELWSLFFSTPSKLPNRLAPHKVLLELRWAYVSDLEQRCDNLEEVQEELQGTALRCLGPWGQALLLQEIARCWVMLNDNYPRTSCTCKDDDGWDPGYSSGPSQVCTSIREQYIFEICNQSVKMHPLKSTYLLGTQPTLCERQPMRALELLDSWEKAFPDDPDRLERAVVLFSRLERWQDAERSLTELERQRGKTPELQARRRDMVFSQALALCGKKELALPRMETLLQNLVADERWMHVLKDVLRWFACGKDRKSKRTYSQLLGDHQMPLLVLHCCRVIAPAFLKARLPKPVLDGLSLAEPVMAGLEALADITDPTWRVSPGEKNFDWLLRQVNGPGLHGWARTDCRYALRFLRACIRVDFEKGIWTSGQLTALHLQCDPPEVSAFWGLRALVYAHLGKGLKLAATQECLAMALKLGTLDEWLVRELRKLEVDLKGAQAQAQKLTKSKIQQLTKREKKRDSVYKMRNGAKIPYHTGFSSPKPRPFDTHPLGFDPFGDDEPFDFNPLDILDELEEAAMGMDFDLDQSAETLLRLCREEADSLGMALSHSEIMELIELLNVKIARGPGAMPPEVIEEVMKLVGARGPDIGGVLRVLIKYELQKLRKKKPAQSRKSSKKTVLGRPVKQAPDDPDQLEFDLF